MGVDFYACDNCGEVRHEDSLKICNDECSKVYCDDKEECLKCIWDTGKKDEYGERIIQCVHCTHEEHKKCVTDEDIIKFLLSYYNKTHKKNILTKESCIELIKQH
jgi:hypothetical protein